MFIKFDDLDMLEFFENEPISIGEEGEAKYIYSTKDSHQFSMTLTVDTYAKKLIFLLDMVIIPFLQESLIMCSKSEKAKMFY